MGKGRGKRKKTRKQKEEETMANGATWNGIPLKGQPYSNVIFVPENIPHHYDSNGDLKVDAVGSDSQGNTPDDPPAEFQADGYHRGSVAAVWALPHAGMRSDGSVETSGFLPDGTWVEATGTPATSDTDKAVKAFHDALADPSSLVAKAAPDKTAAFVTAVLEAANKFIAP